MIADFCLGVVHSRPLILNMRLKELKALCIDVLRMQGKSKNTISVYVSRMDSFISFMGAKNTVEYTDVIRYGKYLYEHYDKERTRYGRLQAVRTLATQAEMLKIPFVPVSYIILPKIKDSKRTVPTIEELYRIIKKIKTHILQGLRNRAILETFMGSGCRISELCSLNKAEVNFHLREFTTLTKGAKWHTYQITARGLRWIKKYLRMRGDDDNPALFTTAQDRINDETIRVFFRKVKKEAGIERDIRIHDLRHFFANNFLENGGVLTALQEQLGHSAVTTTMLYVRHNSKFLRREFKRARIMAST